MKQACRHRKTLSLLILLAISVSVPAWSAEEDWERLTAESFELYQSGRYDAAIRVSREALEAAEDTFGTRHQVVGKSMNNLGAMLSKHGDRAEAEILLTGALDILEESLGKDHPGTSSALNNLAELYSSEKMYKQAEPLFLRALAIREKAPGDENRDLTTTIDNLAFLYMKTERFRDAEGLYRRSFEIREKTFDHSHPEVERSADNLLMMLTGEGNLRKEQERFDEAIAAYKKALDLMSAHPHPEARSTAKLKETLAVLSVRTGDLDEAVSYYEDAINSIGLPRKNSTECARLTRDIARVYVRMERYEKAVPLYESVVEVQGRLLDSGDPELARSLKEQAAAMTSLAKSYLESGNSEDAIPLFAQAIEIRKKTGPADDPSLAIRMNNLASLLVELQQFEEAERLYSEALGVLERSEAGGGSSRTLILQNMQQLYRLTGDLEKAAVVDSLLTGAKGGP